MIIFSGLKRFDVESSKVLSSIEHREGVGYFLPKIDFRGKRVERVDIVFKTFNSTSDMYTHFDFWEEEVGKKFLKLNGIDSLDNREALSLNYTCLPRFRVEFFGGVFRIFYGANISKKSMFFFKKFF